MFLRLLNNVLNVLKNILFFITTIVIVYIITLMFKRLDKAIISVEFISNLVPLLLNLLLCIIVIIFKKKNITNNLFFNVISFVASLTICMICYRTLFDKNMIMWHKGNYKVNFSYFADQIAPIKVILYGLIVPNILLLFEKDSKKQLDY